MIKTGLPDATVGVTVQDVASGEILYDYHGSKHFLPASTTKLFTAAAALKLLGPDYRYDTTLYYDAAGLQQGVHRGDVALKFTGDPSFKLAALYSLLQNLSEAHIKEIKGDFIIDDTIYAGPLLGLGWTWDSTAWYHAAPVAAIIIDRNQFGVTLFPTPKHGAKVAAKLEQEYPGAKFINLRSDIKAVTFQESETICQLAALVDEKNNVEINGCWPLGTQPVHLRLAVKDPRLQAQHLILDALNKLNIKLTGKIKYAAVPVDLKRLARHSSEPLAVLLKPILGESNNLYAETLTKTLGAKIFGVGSFKTGSLAVQQILSQVTGIDFAQTRIMDGSGESRYNLLTPMHLTRLLYTMQQEPTLGIHFRNALAMSGMNGSLKNRFKTMSSADKIQAKTGSLNGVSTLAGYFTTRHNRELIVTIMINHAMENNALLKQFEEELCTLIVNQL
jgi:D-alanyl-D-alanine carboxypeptidase/D-alanyl-D-alanine-endopeptidase (penicillin-binding protein 4)